MKPRIGYIYRIINNITGSEYIGSTARSIAYRWCVHQRDAKKGKHHSRFFQRAWNKYGASVFRCELVEVVYNLNLLLICEQRHIDEAKLRLGRSRIYNVCLVAGNCLGRKWSEADRQRLAVAHIGKRVTKITRRKIAKTWDSKISKRTDFVSPNGRVYLSVGNVRLFARQHKLCEAGLGVLVRRVCKSYCGWTLLGNAPPVLSFVRADGKIYGGIKSLKEFCSTHRLNYKKMSAVNAGSAFHHHGWKKGPTTGIEHKRWSKKPRVVNWRSQYESRAKLNPDLVLALRYNYFNRHATISQLAEAAFVCRKSVYNAIFGRTWKHVTGSL